jgi:hypothetical protein
LHEIISATKKPEVQIRTISELHSIEMSIFSFWKQLPDLQIDDSRGNRNEYEYDNVGRNGLPRAISYGPEEDERQDRAEFFGWKQGDPPLDSRFRAMMEQKYGLDLNRGIKKHGIALIVKDGLRMRNYCACMRLFVLNPLCD